MLIFGNLQISIIIYLHSSSEKKNIFNLIIVARDLIIAPHIEKWLLLFKIYLHILYTTYEFNKKKDTRQYLYIM